MKRTLLSFAVTLSVLAGLIQPAPATALDGGEPSSFSSDSSDSSDSSELPEPTGAQGSSAGDALVVVALIAAVGGGALWAVQQGLIPNPLPGVIPGPPAPAPAPEPRRGDCSPRAFNNALWEWRDSVRTSVRYCDGGFAWVAQNQTDWRVAFEFDGRAWNVSRPAGTTRWGMMEGCYNGIELRNRGASEEFLSMIPICAPDEIGYSPW
ncbi:hypothetical protein [Corynebacterium pacaense]|uniref:hypothetical protein n=1 Tax=Corynebacterium pacaense TaxID=1816684 RepID=UPI0009BB5F61|nr:hypothetical protein [Corynebacterium pacaense]